MIRSALDQVLPGVIADLQRLVAIPSVSSLPEHDDDVLAAADEVSRLLRDAGCPEVRLLEAGGKPAVYGHYPAPEGQPTVLLYAHYDVQPTGDLAQWTSAPFEAVERDGRLWGRGTADDKGGFAAHLAALRAYDGKPPVGVKVFIEGEEELGSPTIDAMLDKYPDELTADVYVVADAINWEVGTPSITTTLRGLVDAKVTVSTLESPLHSGGYGGVVPDALTALARLLATLHDERGNVAIEGLDASDDVATDYSEARLREETGLLEGVEFIGDGPAAARMWTKPTASVLAIDATPVKDVSNVLVASARAVVSVRLAPTQDPEAAGEALERHLLENAPWGARVDVELGRGSGGSRTELSGGRAEAAVAALREAFGTEPVEVGIGGSIPIVAQFAARNPGSLVLVTAVTDPLSRIHGIDESLGLDDFAKAALAETLLLDKLAGDL
ncbi:MAG: M20/M25/M40 family metallo-hydrolase [Propionibacterium sp.]|nr:M20/M25/M40 family metallo-hydrolase [Propionibacterium sp.]